MPTLNWIGKDKVINHHNDVPYRVLEKKYTFDLEGMHIEESASSDNMIIHGDNLEALKSLLPKYEGKIKCIYIDPPYNTGNEGWVYNDNVNDPRIRMWLGKVVGSEAEDLSRHDKWLCMMYPRLVLLRKLLSDDGVIFISIDDREQVLLRMICNEIFGENNFLAQIVWQKRTSPDMRKLMSTAHEYIVVYAKDISNLDRAINKLELTEDDVKNYKNPDDDPRGPWASSDFTAQGFRPNQMYEITTPAGVKYTPPEGCCWKNVEEEFLKQVEEGRIWFGKDGKGIPRRKTYLREREGKNVWTWWDNKSVGHSQEATKEIVKIFGNSTVFDYSKPSRMIQRIVQIATRKDSIVLDSFAGSGTTAHAVLMQNLKDNGNRKFILIEMEEYAESVTAERYKRIITTIMDSNENVKELGFSFYEVGQRIFDEEGNFNKEIEINKIKEYIWYSETKTKFEDSGEESLLGVINNTAYYFLYDVIQSTVLDIRFLSQIKLREDAYVIYADTCAISESDLAKWNITFKKIPRDITKL